MSNKLTDNINDLGKLSKKFAEAYLELAKLNLLEKLTEVTTHLINSFVIILFGAIALFFGLAAYVVWYGQTYHDYLTGLMYALIFLIILAIVFILFRKKIVGTSVLKSYSAILFDDSKKDVEL